MCCEINIVRSISLKMYVNVHECAPNKKPYVNTGIDSLRWTMLCACVIGVSKL